jgi:hypothetical protein
MDEDSVQPSRASALVIKTLGVIIRALSRGRGSLGGSQIGDDLSGQARTLSPTQLHAARKIPGRSADVTSAAHRGQTRRCPGAPACVMPDGSPCLADAGTGGLSELVVAMMPSHLGSMTAPE